MLENLDIHLALAKPVPEEDVTTTLYRAAIGPMGTDFYLPIFCRFEDANRAGISWNTAASLTTFNWLIFRRLWGPALAYAGAICTLLLLVFGLGHWVLGFSDTLIGVMVLVFGLTSFVLPGLFANAVFHTHCRRRIDKALAAYAVLSDACQTLTAQASNRRRAVWLAGANVAFFLVLGVAYSQITMVQSLSVIPQGALEVGPVGAQAPSAEVPSGNASASGVVSQVPKSTDLVIATASETAASKSAVPKPFLVNVGLFAVASNAAKADAKLQKAGLPSVTHEIQTTKGLLTRVRAGPFANQEEAQAAVVKIKALGLDAIMAQP